MAKQPSNIEKLYNSVNQEYDLGSFEQFKQDMSDPVKRGKLHNAIAKDYELPDLNSFSRDMGFGEKKNPKEKPLASSGQESFTSGGKFVRPNVKPFLQQTVTQQIAPKVTPSTNIPVSVASPELLKQNNIKPKKQVNTLEGLTKEVVDKVKIVAANQKKEIDLSIGKDKNWLQTANDIFAETVTSAGASALSGVAGLIGGIADLTVNKTPNKPSGNYTPLTEEWLMEKLNKAPWVQQGEVKDPAWWSNQGISEAFMGWSKRLQEIASAESNVAKMELGTVNTQKTTVDNLLEGNYSDFGKSLVVDIAAQAPQMLAIAATGGSNIALGTMGAMSAGSDMQRQYEEQGGNLSLNDVAQSINIGILNAVSEKIFDTNIVAAQLLGKKLSSVIGRGGQALQQQIRNEGADVVKEKVIRGMADAFKASGKGFVEEAVFEEGLVSVGSFFIDALDEDKLNQKGFEQLGKDLLTNLLVAGPMGGSMSYFSALASIEPLTQSEKRQISKYQEIINSDDASKEVKDIAKSKLNDIKSGINSSSNEIYDKLVNLPLAERISAIDKLKRITTLKEESQKQVDVEMKDSINQRIVELNSELESIINTPQAQEGQLSSGGQGAVQEVSNNLNNQGDEQTKADVQTQAEAEAEANVLKTGEVDTSPEILEARRAAQEFTNNFIEQNMPMSDKIQKLESRMNDADLINENDIKESTDALYDLLDEVDKLDVDNEVKQSMLGAIEEKIKKLEGYEFETTTEIVKPQQERKVLVSRQIVGETSRGSKNKNEVTKARFVGKNATANKNNGVIEYDEKTGVLSVVHDNGRTDLDFNFLEYQDSIFDADGNIQGVKLVDKLTGDEIEVNDQDLAYDIAIKEKIKQIGDVSDSIFDEVYDTIVEPAVTQEVLKPKPSQPTTVKPVTLQDKVDQLRKDEQAEYDALPDPNDEAARREIYDRYDEKITPLLKEIDDAKAKADEADTKADEAKVEQIASTSGTSPKNIRELYKVNRNLFGLDRVKAFASAVAMDRMVGAMAKRAKITKTEMYGRLKFEKVSEDFVKNLSEKGKVLWQIVGENANLSQTIKDNLRSAREMELAGKDAKTIRIATGWEKGADKKWKFEISSGKLKGEPRTVEGKLSDLLDNKELFEMYPQLKDVNVSLRLNGLGTGDYSSKGIVVNGGMRDMLSILNHEVQHAIQGIEGFARGGNIQEMTTKDDVLQGLASPLNFPKLDRQDRIIARQKTIEKGLKFSEVFYFDVIKDDPDIIEDAIERLEILNDISPNDIYVKLITALDYKLMDMGGENIAFVKYKKLAGEVEARNVQKRMDMSNEQKRDTLLSETEDIARDEQIVLFQKDDKARGAVMVSMDGQAVIYALSDPNVSTPLHELAHVFEHYLTDAEKAEVMKSAKTKDWNVKTSEYFARGFEKYLAEGKSPIAALDKIFAKFKEWLTDIYNGIKGSDIDIKLNKQMREIYASMLISDTIGAKEADEKAVKMMADVEKAILEKGKKSWWNSFRRHIFNRTPELDDILSKTKRGQEARKFNENVPGSVSYADQQFLAAEAEIYGELMFKLNKTIGKIGVNINKAVSDISKAKENSLNQMIFLKRVINIDENTVRQNKAIQKEIDDLKEQRSNTKDVKEKEKLTKYINQRKAKIKEPVKHPRGFNGAEAKLALEGMKQRIEDEEFNDIENRANKYAEVRREMLLTMAEEGLISQKTFDNLVSDDYVERKFLDKIFEDTNFSANSSLLPSQMIKALAGGSEELLLTDTRMLLHSAYRSLETRVSTNRANKILFEAVDSGELDPKFGRVARFKKNLNGTYKVDPLSGNRVLEEVPTGMVLIPQFTNGERSGVFVKQEYADQWNDVVKIQLKIDPYLKVAFGTTTLKTFATLVNASFATKNIPRDFFKVIYLSDTYDNNLLTSIPRLIGNFSSKAAQYTANKFGVGTKSFQELLDDYTKYGGKFEFLHKDGKNTNLYRNTLNRQKRYIVRLGGKAYNLFENALGLPGEISEISMRLAVFDKKRSELIDAAGGKQNISPKEMVEINVLSANASRAIMDYNKGGLTVKWLDNFSPYLNASTVGFTSDVNYIKKNPKMFAAKMALLGLNTMAITLWNLMSGDEEDYKNIPQYIKDNSFIFIIPGKIDNKKYYVAIPKYQGLQLPTAIFEESTIAMWNKYNGTNFGKGDSSIDRFASTASNWSPIPFTPKGIMQKLPPVGNAAIAYFANYDSYRDSKIEYKMEEIPTNMEGLYDKDIARIYKVLGDLSTKLGDKRTISPSRTQAGVEKVITNPRTNFLVGEIYGILDWITRNYQIPMEIEKSNPSSVKSNIKSIFIREIDPNYAQRANDFYKKEDMKAKGENEYQKKVIKSMIDAGQPPKKVAEFIKNLDLSDSQKETKAKMYEDLLREKSISSITPYYNELMDIRYLQVDPEQKAESFYNRFHGLDPKSPEFNTMLESMTTMKIISKGNAKNGGVKANSTYERFVKEYVKIFQLKKSGKQ